MKKVLIICGPTATGKTAFSVEIAKLLNGEIVSADSRQIYVGRDLITGKDITGPSEESQVVWREKKLKYYLIDGIRVWLYDIVSQGENFNVSYWKECADLVIADILSRGKLPIVVGGTGLFIKALTQNLSDIDVPYNESLRQELETKSVEELFDYLKSEDPTRANSLNESDAKNPRRLIRAIEISIVSKKIIPPLASRGGSRGSYNYLQVCLSTTTKELYPRIDQRVDGRIAAGAALEDPELASDPQKWKFHEHGLARRQITWFKKQPDLIWFDISAHDWHTNAIESISNWYNKSDA